MDLRETAYAALWRESREAFLTDLASCADDINKAYRKAGERLANRIGNMKFPGSKELSAVDRRELKKIIQEEVSTMTEGLQGRIQVGVKSAYKHGGVALTALAVDSLHGIAKAPQVRAVIEKFRDRALEAYVTKTRFGWEFSDRIWVAADQTSRTIHKIVTAGIADGQGSVQVAKTLEKYVYEGAKTLSASYPEMMARMGGRIPGRLSYEALRLARTEMAFAANEGTIQSCRDNPYCIGVGFRIANSHPKPDICDEVATADKYGLGPGNYPLGNEVTTQHPNCLCCLVPLVGDPEPERLAAFISEVGK